MAIRLSVAEQNSETKREILRAASYSAFGGTAPKWLCETLERFGLSISSGILVAFYIRPDQRDNLALGTWLAQDCKFWRFQCVVSEDGSLIEVESFEDISMTTSTSAHEKGTGKSFGFLARQVLQDHLAGQGIARA